MRDTTQHTGSSTHNDDRTIKVALGGDDMILDAAEQLIDALKRIGGAIGHNRVDEPTLTEAVGSALNHVADAIYAESPFGEHGFTEPCLTDAMYQLGNKIEKGLSAVAAAVNKSAAGTHKTTK